MVARPVRQQRFEGSQRHRHAGIRRHRDQVLQQSVQGDALPARGIGIAHLFGGRFERSRPAAGRADAGRRQHWRADRRGNGPQNQWHGTRRRRVGEPADRLRQGPFGREDERGFFAA